MYEVQGAGEGGVVSWVLPIGFLTPFGDAEFQTRAYPSLEGCLQGGSEMVSEFNEQNGSAFTKCAIQLTTKVECQRG